MRLRMAAPAAVGALAVGLLVAAPSSPASASGGSTSYEPPPIAWGACVGDLEGSSAECGYLTVPLDYAKPDGTKIKLYVSRKKHTVPDADYQGVMLVNPGGPGGSGIVYSFLGGSVPKKAGAAYDWIGFDPRGVGLSEPSLSCDGTYFGLDRPQYIPYTKKLEQTWLDRSAGYSKDCAKADGAEILGHAKTVDSVNDMDSLRKALGQSQINFYGFSYGSYLGQVYATLHPAQTRRFVLDGVVDPTRVWYQANLDQDVAFDANMDVYWKWLAKYDSVYHLGTSWKKIKAAYYLEYAKLDRKAIDGVGPDELNDVMLSAGYYVYGWEDIGSAFAALINEGDASGIKEMYETPQEPGSDNGFAMYNATQCTDVKWPQSYSTWRRDSWATFAKAPFLTWNNTWYNAPCLTWPAKAGTPVTVNGSKAPPILLIAETKDAATPYSGALKARSLFPKSVLIEGVGGTTHAGSLSGVSCTDDTIADYLLTGKLPARKAGGGSDVQCPPVPQPDPTAVTAAEQKAASGSSRLLAKARQRVFVG
ncbi:alpha/beta hydrolase [Spongisporangium articulatum]|uniref:Alpha/beta hydrolase n=1 Tax=Spongisporangium articulatum TaxID=3362603 RepID=A0ABW8ART1_9ACTN